MDSRGIPIVIPAKKCNTTPKRITTPKRYDTPLSPFFVRSMKNEFSLLDAYDDFYDFRFSSRYHPTSDDMRHNVRDLYKSNMFTEISSPRPSKRMRSSFFMDSDIMDEEQTELPHLEASKKPKDITVSSPMEAMTPLADDALDTLHESQPDLDIHTQTAAIATIPRTTRRTKHVQEESLVDPSQQQEQIVTPKSVLKYQNQVKKAHQTPLPSDDSLIEMPTRQKSAALKQPLVVKPPAKPTHVQQQQQAPTASPQRLTRRQARLIEENGGRPEFAVPEALPPPPPSKRKGRASKRKQPAPKQEETIQIPQETQPLEKAIVQQVPPVESNSEQAIVGQQQEPQQVVNAEDVADVDIHVDDAPEEEATAAIVIKEKQEQKLQQVVNAENVVDVDMHVNDAPEEEAAAVVIEEKQEQKPPQVINAEDVANVADVDMHVDDVPEEEAATAIVIKEKQEQKAESIKAEKSEKELQEEKLRAYRKKKAMQKSEKSWKSFLK